MWDEHLEPLAAAGQRIVAVDLPGFGDAAVEQGPVAPWEDVLETMDALGIERAAIAGNSFGASVALRVAAFAPERVTSLALFSASAVPEPDPSPELLAAWEGEEGPLEQGDTEAAVAAVLSAWVWSGADEEVGRRIAAMQRRNYELHASAPEPEQAPDPLEEDPALLGKIECPVLLAAGEHDVVDFEDALPALAARLPRAETTLIAGCGHLAPLEAPEEFRRLVLAAL
jgi:pimeloyl-ACP methyl ester carboxylesterase